MRERQPGERKKQRGRGRKEEATKNKKHFKDGCQQCQQYQQCQQCEFNKSVKSAPLTHHLRPIFGLVFTVSHGQIKVAQIHFHEPKFTTQKANDF